MTKNDEKNSKESTKWTSKDEAVLVAIFDKAKLAGLMVENGFKPTVWTEAVQALTLQTRHKNSHQITFKNTGKVAWWVFFFVVLVIVQK